MGQVAPHFRAVVVVACVLGMRIVRVGRGIVCVVTRGADMGGSILVEAVGGGVRVLMGRRVGHSLASQEILLVTRAGTRRCERHAMYPNMQRKNVFTAARSEVISTPKWRA